MKHIAQPSFDFEQEVPYAPTAGESPASVIPELSIPMWREVPQARFLSWSERMQWAYCAARDLDSADSAHERGEDPEFYLERAEAYAVEALKA